MELVPAWTKAGYWSLGRDPLGMQATSVRLYRKLLPGMTNVTNRLRYYAYYTWVVRQFERRRHSTDEAKWQLFIRRAEALYALSCFAVDPEQSDGLGGGRWALRQTRDLAKRFDLRPHTDRPGEAGQYLKAKRGNFGQFYIASMVEVGLLDIAGRIPFVTVGWGAEMAAAFESSTAAVLPILDRAIETGRLTVRDLERIGEAVHPSNIPSTSREMTELHRYLYDDDSIPGTETRRASAWLALDLMGRGLPPGNQLSFRRAFYNRAVGAKGYPATGSTIERWRAYQANEFAHICLEAILNDLVTRLARAGEAQPQTLITALLAAPIKALGCAGLTWRDWAASRAAKGAGGEEELAEPILAALVAERWQGGADVIEAAVSLLAILWGRWSSGPNPVLAEIAAAAGRYGRSLAGVIATLDRHADRPVGEALSAAIRAHVISGHLAVAGRKLAGSGNFTYHFRSADGVLTDGHAAPYNYTNPRLGNLLRFLEDAGFHEKGELTASGRRFVRDRKPA